MWLCFTRRKYNFVSRGFLGDFFKKEKKQDRDKKSIQLIIKVDMGRHAL